MARKRKPAPDRQPENISGYFRKIFAENPRLLKSRSNDELLDRWLADHPGTTEVPVRVKQGLANVKSVLRSKRRKRKARKATEEAASAGTVVAKRPASKNGLIVLEEQIDECLIMARLLDVEGLDSIIQHLRLARNEVVWKMGE